MKTIYLILLSLLLSLPSCGQQFDSTSISKMIDSLLAQNTVLTLTMSTPQPRLGEAFTIMLDMTWIRAQMFRGELNKFSSGSDFKDPFEDMSMSVKATQIGKQTLGPLKFTLNGLVYTSNRINYEVVDALPEVNEGMWIRQVRTNDSTLDIIIEQRIPADDVTKKTANSIQYTVEPRETPVAAMKYTSDIKNLRYKSSSNYNYQGHVTDSTGEEGKAYIFHFSVNHFNIKDPKEIVKIGRDAFENIPAYYHYKDIVIHP